MAAELLTTDSLVNEMMQSQLSALTQLDINAQLFMVSTSDGDVESEVTQGKYWHGARLWDHLDKIGASFRHAHVFDPYQVAHHIDQANANPHIQAVVMQVPILGASRGIVARLCRRIDPIKDVDGLNPESSQVSPTAEASFAIADRLFGRYDEPDLSDLRITILGSGFVGGPLADIFHAVNLDPRVVNLENGQNPGKAVSESDLVFAAMGHRHFITAKDVNAGTTLIDISGDLGPDIEALTDIRLAKVKEVGKANAAFVGRNLVQACQTLLIT